MADWLAPPTDAVFHGPAGEFVRLTEPHTESDPMALLSQFLVTFGTAAGRGRFYEVEASRHHANEFLVLVGPSGKGRKGSSWGHVEAILREVDPRFVEDCVSSGLSSGEGLIAEVRDGDHEQNRRRLVVEPEFAQVLKVLAREGNTLSPVLRNAWDGKTLQTMVKSSPLRASDAHISVVGHITKDELLRHIDATELANGFLNRFLLVAVRRSKELPFGGSLQGNDLVRVRVAVERALDFTQCSRQVTFSPAAREAWIATYSRLSADTPGLFGTVMARAEAHVVRLALIYALLDCSETIQLAHLEAALGVWAYAVQSARWIFGESLGDPTADEIWAFAREHPSGFTRTDVANLFSRNKKAREMNRAVAVLVDAGRLERLADCPGHGRPAERWLPVLSEP